MTVVASVHTGHEVSSPLPTALHWLSFCCFERAEQAGTENKLPYVQYHYVGPVSSPFFHLFFTQFTCKFITFHCFEYRYCWFWSAELHPWGSFVSAMTSAWLLPALPPLGIFPTQIPPSPQPSLTKWPWRPPRRTWENGRRSNTGDTVPAYTSDPVCKRICAMGSWRTQSEAEPCFSQRPVLAWMSNGHDSECRTEC